MSQRFQPFFSNTQRVAPFFFEYDAKSWTLFLSIRRKELNPFLSSDAKNWTILSRSMTQRIEPCVKKRLKECNSCWRTHRIEPLFMNLFSIWLKELKSFFSMWLKELKGIGLFRNAQGIEPLFHMNYFFTWLELNSFLINTTRRVTFFHKKMTQSVEHLFWIWLKELNLVCTGLKELNLFSICLNELNLFLEYDPRESQAHFWIEPFFAKKNDSKNVLKVKKWLNELNLLVIRLTELKLRLDT